MVNGSITCNCLYLTTILCDKYTHLHAVSEVLTSVLQHSHIQNGVLSQSEQKSLPAVVPKVL